MTGRYEMLMSVMEQRRSVRAFQNRKVDRVLIDKVLDAALTAPSPGNRQSFRFLVVESSLLNKKMADAVGAVVKELKPGLRDDMTTDAASYLSNFTHFAHAPVLIVPIYRKGVDLLAELAGNTGVKIAGRNGDADSLGSVAAAVMNLTLAAESLGLGTCWMTGPLIARSQLEALLSVPGGWEMAAVVPLGYPDASPPVPPKRKRDRMIRYIEEG